MNYTAAQRKALAAIGQALPDGSYPIKNRQDLANAIKLVGVGNTPTATVKAFCIKRAKALNAMSMIPANWMASGAMGQSDAVTAILEHHGVKGMKWGVRRDKGHEGQQATNKKIAKLDRKFERKTRQPFHQNDLQIKIHNEAARQMNAVHINRINNKPQYKNQAFDHDTPLRRKYQDEMQRTFVQELEKAAKGLGTNASGTQRYGILENNDGSWTVAVKDVKHAGGEQGMHVNVIYGSRGEIIKIEIPPNAMAQTDDLVADFLSHFGVKGMQWGVRRSTTGGGRKTSTDAKKAAATKAKIKSHGRQSVSNKQLKDLVTRMNLEKQHTTLSRESASFTKGHEAAKNILAVAGTASAAFALFNSPLGKAVRSALKSNITRTVANAAKTGSTLVVAG